MYAAPNRRTSHRLAALDVPTPRWMRAPGECPGMFALESAMDELAAAAGLDPVELRVRNEPDVDPEHAARPSAAATSSPACGEGAERFGWAGRDPRPGVRREGRWLVGTGVASATYPVRTPVPAPARATARGRRATRSRSTPPTSAPAPGPCSPRSPRTRSASTRRGGPAAIGDSALPDGAGRRRVDGHRVLGLGGQPGLRRLCGQAPAARRRPRRGAVGRRVDRRRARGAGGAVPARVRRPLRRGAGRRRHRRGPGAADARGVRRRTHPQPPDGPLASSSAA